MYGFLRKWWILLVYMHWRNFYRSAPSTTADPGERAYRLEHWDESTKANWHMLRLQWSRLLEWRLPPKERKDREIHRMFTAMNHPMAGTRQLVEWRRRGPHNPPPAVRNAISVMHSIDLRPAMRESAAQISE